jgi:SAM-dependent methyltransferase
MPSGTTAHDAKRQVRGFYDTFGWRKNAAGAYHDTAVFVDQRPVLAAYRARAMARVRRLLPARGRLFLDAGSGAIPHPDDLAHSAGFDRRVCVDFSTLALTEARAKLGRRGLYVAADLARLPFRAGVFDATVCAHVLYHVPAEEQESVVRELYRTLGAGGRAVIVYARPRCPLTRLALWSPRQAVAGLPGARAAWRWLRGRHDEPAAVDASPAPPLYFRPFEWTWFRRFAGWRLEVRIWQAADRPFTTRFVPDGRLGRWILEALGWLEERCPHAMVRVGRYPLVVIDKASDG